MPEFRQNMLTNEWVIIATERAKRPEDFQKQEAGKPPVPEFSETCPFCPGHESLTPPHLYKIQRNGKWQVRVVPNKFAAPDKRQVTVRYLGLYANAHRGKVRKSEAGEHKLLIIEEKCPRIPRRGWAEMIRKVYEVNPFTCVQCGGTMKVIAFLTDYSVVDKIIDHLKLTFVAERPPPPQMAFQEVFMAAEASTEYSW